MKKQRDEGMWRGQLRLPGPLATWVKERADESYRSLNAELVAMIKDAKKAAGGQNAAQ